MSTTSRRAVLAGAASGQQLRRYDFGVRLSLVAQPIPNLGPRFDRGLPFVSQREPDK
jgi:hypothetical protein